MTISLDKNLEIFQEINNSLEAAAEVVVEDHGISPISTYLGMIPALAFRMSSLDPKTTAVLFRAMADMFDPASTEKKQEKADAVRLKAEKRLMRAYDLMMAETEGSA